MRVRTGAGILICNLCHRLWRFCLRLVTNASGVDFLSGMILE